MPPVPANITDLSQTAGSNSPAGSESPALLDDYTRTVFAFIAKLRDGQGLSAPVDLASAATTDIGAQTSPIVRITGTTTITSFGTNYAGPRFLTFAGALTLTHNATSLILPGGANITTAVGDCCIAVPNATTPNGWRVVSYQRALFATAFSDIKQAASETATGVVEKLTTAEAQTGTDDTRYHSAATMKAAQIQLGTPVTLSTQTNVDFTSIPSWAKRVNILFRDVSTNGTSNPIVQLGDSGGVETSGYLCSGSVVLNGVSPSVQSYSTGFGAPLGTPANTFSGNVTLELVNTSTNTWVASGVFGLSNVAAQAFTAGSKSLSATLDRVRLTTVTGVDQFDGGTINISWE